MAFNCLETELTSIINTSQDKSEKMWLDFQSTVDSCVKIPYDKYVGTVSDTGGSLTTLPITSHRWVNKLNCDDKLCLKRGALQFTPSTPTSVDPSATTIADIPVDADNVNAVIYKIQASTIDYAFSGAVTYYINTPAAGTYSVRTWFSDTPSFTNADIYETTITTTTDATQIDLSQFSEIPTIVGTGWDKTMMSGYIKIAVIQESVIADPIRIGNGQVFSDIEELVPSDLAWLSCIDSIAFNPTKTMTDPTCGTQSLDDQSLAKDFTVTAGKWSPNLYEKVAYFVNKELQSYGIPVIIEGTVVDGVFQLPDYDANTCGFVGAQSDECTADDGRMKYVPTSNGNSISVDTDNFTIVNVDGVYYAKFDEYYEGSQVKVIYPRTRNVEVMHYDLSINKMRKARASYWVRNDNGRDLLISLMLAINSMPFLSISSGTNDPIDFEMAMIGNEFEIIKVLD